MEGERPPLPRPGADRGAREANASDKVAGPSVVEEALPTSGEDGAHDETREERFYTEDVGRVGCALGAGRRGSGGIEWSSRHPARRWRTQGGVGAMG